MPPLTDAVAAASARHDLLPPGARVLVAVSGGPDSCVLLDVLRRLAGPHGLRLAVGHFHHGMRGAEADADAAFVEGLAAALDLPYFVGRYAEPQADEAALRGARYAWLADAATAWGASHVAVGHTRDDQVETVLLRLLRGAGLAGLGGMRPKRPLSPASQVQLIRPLLTVSREAVLAYAREHDLRFHADSSNDSARYRRNRIRRDLLPAVRALQPDADAHITRMADLLAGDEAFLSEAARVAGASASVRCGVGWEVYDRSALDATPAALRTRILRVAYQNVLGAPYPPDAASVLAVSEALAVADSEGAADWPGNVRARWSRDAVSVVAVPDAAQLEPRPLTVPGAVMWPATAQEVRAHLVDGAAPPTASSAHSLRIDPATAPGALVVRGWRPGDEWQPRGTSHRERVGETLRKLGVPADRRPAIPLVASEEGVWWVTCAGLPASGGASATGALLELTVSEAGAAA